MKQDEKSKGKPALSSVLIQTGVPAAVGLVFFLVGKLIAAKVLWGVSGVLLISGLFIPPVFNRIEQFGRWFGKWAGLVITWVLLVPLFFLVFLPGRLILMVRGIDPMCRKFPTDAPTYWVPRKPVTNLEEYKRQF
ncbi:MAG: hypothetical protein WCS52_11190 [bacterium]